MNNLSSLICKLLMIPASFSYYAPITKWVKRLGSRSFFELPVSDIKWKIIRKKGFARIFVGKPYALAIAAIRLNSLGKAWKRIYRDTKPSMPERLLEIVQETESVSFCPQHINLPLEWRYKEQGHTVFSRLHTSTCRLSPDYTPLFGEQTSGDIPAEEVCIIIPVYNGKKHLERLLPSLFKNTTSPHKFIFVDDCSPDTSVLPWLKQQCAERSDCIILANDTNMGFPATVNKGAKHSNGHFVILNTDTEVPAKWLERLMNPIWNNPQIASVTPFSDAATIFSFPFFEQDTANHEFLSLFGLQKIDSIIQQNLTPAPRYDAPTGVGFCMAINHQVWNTIGGLDAETFGKGYGEENDWCQRAIKAGYKNIIEPHLFVAHHHGGSFDSEQKKQLIAASAANINRLHPSYAADVRDFIRDDPWKEIRAAGIMRLLLNEPCTHTLYLTFSWGGGSKEYLNHRIEQDIAEKRCSIILTYDHATAEYQLDFYYRDFHFGFTNISRELLFGPDFKSIDTIVINQLVTWPAANQFFDTTQWIIGLQQHLQCRLVYLAHDYFAICPGITQLTHGYKLCPLDVKSSRCADCPQVNPLWHSADLSLPIWRTNWGKLLNHCDEVRCFSHSTSNYFKKAYPTIENRLSIVPHAQQLVSEKKFTPCTDQLNICVIGAISEIKGSMIVSEFARLLEKSHPEATINIVGEWFGAELRPNMRLVSRYDKKHILDILHHLKATFCLFPSVWPETFSYVISELMELEVPIVSFNLGAQGERLSHYTKALLLNEISAKALLNGTGKMPKMIQKWYQLK